MTEQQVEVNGPTSPTSSRGPTPAFMRNLTANAEMCVSCNKRVYAVDRLSTGNLVYHKACFRCTQCQKILSISQYTLGDNKPYCKPHYERVFKESGGRYKFGEYRSPAAGNAAGSTPVVVRQTSSSRGSITPLATSGGPTSPGLLSPTLQTDASSAERDSAGNVKRLSTGTFKDRLAAFQNLTVASPTTTTGSRGGTPAKSETPSGLVSRMRAEREAACRSQEVSAPRPAVHTVRAAESPSAQRVADRVDEKNEPKVEEKQDKQGADEVEEQKVEEREQSANHRDDELAENHDDQLDVQHQPAAADSDSGQKSAEDEDKEGAQEREEQDLEDEQQSAGHADDEAAAESQDEVHPSVKREPPPAAADSDSDDDEHDYLQLVEEPALDDEEPTAGQKDDSVADEEEQDAEERPAAAESRDDSDQDAAEERHVDQERDQDEVVVDGDGELVVASHEEEDQLVEKQQPPAADHDDDENNNEDDDDDDDDDKHPGKHNEDDDVTAQGKQQDGGIDDLMSF